MDMEGFNGKYILLSFFIVILFIVTGAWLGIVLMVISRLFWAEKISNKEVFVWWFLGLGIQWFFIMGEFL